MHGIEGQLDLNHATISIDRSTAAVAVAVAVSVASS
jgi:hypothetical protein